MSGLAAPSPMPPVGGPPSGPGGPMPGGPMPGPMPGGAPPVAGGLAQGAQAEQGKHIQMLVLQCATMMAGLISEIAKIPGVDQAKFHQAVDMLKQATLLLGDSLPKQGPGAPANGPIPPGRGPPGGPPGGPPPMMRPPMGGPPMGALGAGGPQ